MNAITINCVVKNEKKQRILDLKDNPITIQTGDKVAVLGSNGAGKTTFLKCILNLITYTGEVKINTPISNIGVVFQENNYSELLKTYELFQLVYGFSNPQKIMKQLQKFDLTTLANCYLKDLSGGEKQRVTLALTFAKQHDIYLLDELTTGLDTEKRKKLMFYTKQETREATVLTTSHHFVEIEEWVNKILILEHGRIAFWGEKALFFKTHDHVAVFELKREDHIPTHVQSHISEDTVQYFAFSKSEAEQIKQLLEKEKINYSQLNPSLETYYLLALSKFKNKEVDASDLAQLENSI